MAERDDGGQAFPSEFFETEHGDQVRAFAGSPGMTLRDYMATEIVAAMVGHWLARGGVLDNANAETLAKNAYGMADAMIAERKK